MGAEGRIRTNIEDGGRVIPDTEYGETHAHDGHSHELLYQILTTLKKIEYHLSIGSDTDLSNDNL